MQVVTRKESEQIIIGANSEVVIQIIRIDSDQVHLGIKTNPGLQILTSDRHEEVDHYHAESLAGDGPVG